MKLWCLHIVGPDDVYAAPSKEEAERVAQWLKERWDAHVRSEKKSRGVDWPQIHFRAEQWPHTPESHARSVRNFYSDLGVPPPDSVEQRRGPDCMLTIEDRALVACAAYVAPSVHAIDDMSYERAPDA